MHASPTQLMPAYELKKLLNKTNKKSRQLLLTAFVQSKQTLAI
jgi:hypothetical protein